MTDSITFERIPGPTFTVVDNALLNDSSLSWKATALLAYLLSKPDDWSVYRRQLAGAKKDGIASVDSGLRELINAGYMVRELVRDTKGRIVGTRCRYASTPVFAAARPIEAPDPDPADRPESENPIPGNPDTGNPDTENRALLSTDFNQVLKEQGSDTTCRARGDDHEPSSPLPDPDRSSKPKRPRKTQTAPLTENEIWAWEPSENDWAFARATNPQLGSLDVTAMKAWLTGDRRQEVRSMSGRWRTWAVNSLEYGAKGEPHSQRRQQQNPQRGHRGGQRGPSILDRMTLDQHVVAEKMIGDPDDKIATTHGITVDEVRQILDRARTGTPTPTAPPAPTLFEDDDIIDAEILEDAR